MFLKFILSFLFLLCLKPSKALSAHQNDSFIVDYEAFKYEDHMNCEQIPKLKARLDQTSVSGFSSGSYFASHFHISYSSFIMGAGLVAGGPYSCARSYPLVLNCIHGNDKFPINLDVLIKQVLVDNGKKIDDIAGLRDDKVYILALQNDNIVRPPVVNKQYSLYTKFVNPSNILYETFSAAHTFPTDFDAPGNGECDKFKRPYIANCNFDTAGKILTHIYGPLNTKNTGENMGRWIEFDQKELHEKPSSIGLGKYGYLYVPSTCTATDECRLHIVFHGCAQSVHYSSNGLKFIKNSGYSRWADTNKIILAFPQTQAVWKTTQGYPIHLGKIVACWDMFRMYDSDYENRNGQQISAIRKLIDLLITG